MSHTLERGVFCSPFFKAEIGKIKIEWRKILLVVGRILVILGSILLQVSGLKTKFPHLFFNKHTDWNLPDFTIYVHFAFLLRIDDKKQKYCGYYFQPLTREEKEMQDLKHQHEDRKNWLRNFCCSVRISNSSWKRK